MPCPAAVGESAAPGPHRLEKLPVVFSRGGGKGQETGLVTVTLTRKPLGIEYSHKTLMKVKRVKNGSHAQEAGVEKGWEIVKVGDVDVSQMDYPTTKGILGEMVAKLRQGEGKAEELGWS